jgi:hypothetical protein
MSARVVRSILFVGIALAAQLGLGGIRQAAAQVYDFSFNYDTGFFTGTFVTTKSGSNYTVTGITGATLNGTNYPMLYVVSTNAAYNSPDNLIVNGGTLDNYGVDFNTVPSAPTPTEEFNIYAPNSTEQTDLFNGDVNGQDTVNNTGPLVIGAPQTTPAPIPGAGSLSYLALSLGGLFIYRKRLWRVARMTVGSAV